MLSETVFFLKDLTVDEEYRIVKSKIEQDPELHIINKNKKHVQQTSGNVFYKSSKDLYKRVVLDYKPLDRCGNNRLNTLISAMLFLDPVSNFLETMAEKVSSRIFETQTVAKMLEVLHYFKKKQEMSFPHQKWPKLDAGISPHFENVMYLFDELLKLLHDDLLKRYRFTEDTWEDPEVGAKTKVRPLYPDFSPVVDMFHIKTRNLGERGKATKVVYLNSFELNCSKEDEQECAPHFDLRGHLEKTKSVVIKYPHILSIKLHNSKNVSVPENIQISGKKYTLRTIVCSEEDTGSYFVCLNDKDGLVKMGTTVKKIKSDEGLTPLIAFYIAENYDFNF